jgi:alpha-mannosidase
MSTDHLYFVVHTHWDREWYQPFQQMRARLVAMADRMIPLVESGEIPFFHFDGQTIVLDDYLEIRPEMAPRMKALIRSGKIQVGPWYVLADSFLVSGESLIRNLEIGMASARRFGRPLDVGYLPDQFGHIAQLPQILAGFGFRTAVLWRGVGADVTRNRFVWEAPDGSSLLAVYLPYGYSNGANLPLESVERFIARADAIANRERALAIDTPILVMNGTDHAPPDPRLMTRIREARETSRMSFEVGPLETIVNRIAELPLNGTPHHRGELRSPLRAHLLPGVTSARTWIKQRDFENCYALERLADPLAALANARGVGVGLDAWLQAAWRLELQNHPHDSICGCSVDHVHTDMRYRFDQAAMIAENVVRRASWAIFAQGKARESTLAVFNPTFAHRALVTGEIELADPRAQYFIEGTTGRIPAAVDAPRSERSFELDLPAEELKPAVAALSHPTLMGRTVNRYELRRAADGRIELDLLLSRAALSDLDLEEFRNRVRDEVPDGAKVHIRAAQIGRSRISFVADDLLQAGFSSFRIVRDDAQQPEPTNTKAGSIENEFYSIRAAARGLQIEDLLNDAEFEIHFEDEGDRGDEYNFDPVPGGGTITEPISSRARTLDGAGTRRRISVELEYAIPKALIADRAARDTATEPLRIQLTATLYAGLNRIDFEAIVNNRSLDHRLRVALKTPISVEHALHDTAFAVLQRPPAVRQPGGTEDIYPTVPHRTWSAVESARVSAAILARGLYEVEARRDRDGTTLLLTLLRCIGWLSRSDLAMRHGGAGPELETPGAQELGDHRFEFALATWRGSYLDAAIVQRAAAYAYPPRMFTADAAIPGDLMLARCDNPRIALSTARPGKRAGVYRVRVYNASPDAESGGFSFVNGAKARVVDFAGRTQRRAGMRRSDGMIEIELRPFEILTFEVKVGIIS